MIEFDQIIKETANTTGYPLEVVSKVCKHVFLFTRQIMQDPEDYHEIMFNKLFKFKLKGRFKENKTLNYSPK